MAKDRAARKAAKAAKEAGSAQAGPEGEKGNAKSKKQNPLVKEARQRYAEELKKQGLAQDEIKKKVRTHVKDVLKPAMKQAKQSAKTQNLKGADRRKFIQDTVRGKLGAST